jgi:hypothetical protein
MRTGKSLRFWKSNKLKKGQEEIAGFVVVVLLVAIVLVIILALIIRKQPKEQNNLEINDFLSASFKYTTSCELHARNQYAQLGELFRECHKQSICLDGSKSCDILSQEISALVNSSFKVGVNRPISGYIVNASYVPRNTSSEKGMEVLYLTGGNCTGNYKRAEQYASDDPGKIYISLKLCS